jgi:hypothetical protein
MKIVAALAATVALAGAPSHDGGKPPAAGCPRFELKGTVQALSTTSFTMKPGKKKGGAALTVQITQATQVFWTSQGTLRGPAAGERAWAKGRQCGRDYTATWVLFSDSK